jgi:glutamate synthase domain-containing protein 3
VDLESLELEEDSELIQNLLKEFHEKTGSVRARDILQNWAQEKQFFVKVRQN